MFNLIGFIIAGIIIGFLARALLPGRQRLGLGWTLGLGVAGSLVGGMVATVLGTGSFFELNIIGFVGAVVVSVFLLAAAERRGIGGLGDRDRLGPGS